MPTLKIVLDTNCLLRSVSRRSRYAAILNKLYDNAYDLYLSNEILLEYEEKLTNIFSAETAELVIGAFSLLQNVKKIDPHFQLDLIKTDPDDNKFTDCAFAANVHYLVTDDKHFNVLKTLQFPVISTLSIDEFHEMLQ